MAVMSTASRPWSKFNRHGWSKFGRRQHRVLLPGFAYKFHPGHLRWDRLLKGRTTRIIVTQDTPGWYDRFAYGRPAWRQMKHTVLAFCGLKLLSSTLYAPVVSSTPALRERWLADVSRLAKL